jgi:hypothetical protein
MSSTLAPFTWNGLAWYCKSTNTPPIPPTGVTSPGVWVVDKWVAIPSQTKVQPTVWLWVPMNPGQGQVIPNGSGGAVVAVTTGAVAPYAHQPKPAASETTSGLPAVGWTVVGGTVNWLFTTPDGSPFIDYQGNQIPVAGPNVMPQGIPGGLTGGQWIQGSNGYWAYTNAQQVSSSTGNTGLWLALGGAVAAAGGAAAFL